MTSAQSVRAALPIAARQALNNTYEQPHSSSSRASSGHAHDPNNSHWEGAPGSSSSASADGHDGVEGRVEVFDARPLVSCPLLQKLLLELHGSPGALHDVQGLQNLQGLKELTIIFKCPALSSLRKLLLGNNPAAAAVATTAATADAAAGMSGLTEPSAMGGRRAVGKHSARTTAGAASASGAEQGYKQKGTGSWLGSLLSCFGGGSSSSSADAQEAKKQQQGQQQQVHVHALPASPFMRLSRMSVGSTNSAGGGDGGSTFQRSLAASAAGAGVGRAGPGSVDGSSTASKSRAAPPTAAEVALYTQLLRCLGLIAPVFAVAVPDVSGKLLIATTGRLMLREPQRLLQIRQPSLLAAQLYLQLPGAGGSAVGSGVTLEDGIQAGLMRSGSGKNTIPFRSSSSSSKVQDQQQQFGAGHLIGGAGQDAAGSFKRGQYFVGRFEDEQAWEDAAPLSWVDQVKQGGVKGHRGISILQQAGGLTGAQNASRAAASSKSCVDAVHAVENMLNNMPLSSSGSTRRPIAANALRSRFGKMAGAKDAGGALQEGRFQGPAVLQDQGKVAQWLQQWSHGQLVASPPECYSGLLFGQAAAAAAAAAGAAGEAGEASSVWMEVDEDGDLVGRDVGTPLLLVAKSGVAGNDVVGDLVGVVEQNCFTYFS